MFVGKEGAEAYNKAVGKTHLSNGVSSPYLQDVFVDTDHVVSLLHDLDKDQLLYIHNVVQSLLEIEGGKE